MPNRRRKIWPKRLTTITGGDGIAGTGGTGGTGGIAGTIGMGGIAGTGGTIGVHTGIIIGARGDATIITGDEANNACGVAVAQHTY